MNMPRSSVKQGEFSDLAARARLRLLIVNGARDAGTFGHLKKEYEMIHAAEITHGLLLAQEHAPALLIVDAILLNEDFRSQLTKCFPLKHIPVLAIFQKAELLAQPIPFGSAWDDFLQSPFEAHELLLRVRLMLYNRIAFDDRYVHRQPEESQRVPVNGFLQRIDQLVEENLDNTLFGVAELAVEAAVSQAQLYRKLISLTGLSPNAYIRHIRLKHAVSLLAQGTWNVGEVAYRVGFNSPSYFAKCFKAAHRFNPKEALRRRSFNSVPLMNAHSNLLLKLSTSNP
jgi:AraC-like DNA-binding protein